MSCFEIALVNKYVYDTYRSVLFGVFIWEGWNFLGLNKWEAEKRKAKTESRFSSTSTLVWVPFQPGWHWEWSLSREGFPNQRPLQHHLSGMAGWGLGQLMLLQPYNLRIQDWFGWEKIWKFISFHSLSWAGNLPLDRVAPCPLQAGLEQRMSRFRFYDWGTSFSTKPDFARLVL